MDAYRGHLERHLFLNGHGIQDVYWSDTFATTNLRIYDPQVQQWKVNFFRGPGNSVGTGQWKGCEQARPDGRAMVMWSGSPDRKNGSRLTFSHIGPDGFEWVAEGLKDGVATPSWKSSCKRRRFDSKVKVPAFQGFEPSPAQPFGRPHPRAPRELAQMAFRVGEFVTEEEVTLGPPRTWQGIRTARYVLNGQGIQERAWGPEGASVALLLFDPSRSDWHLSTFRMPAYRWEVWRGGLHEQDLVFARDLVDGQPSGGDRLLSYGAISTEGFEGYQESSSGAEGALEVVRYERR